MPRELRDRVHRTIAEQFLRGQYCPLPKEIGQWIVADPTVKNTTMMYGLPEGIWDEIAEMLRATV